jgi:hypothetical protein
VKIVRTPSPHARLYSRDMALSSPPDIPFEPSRPPAAAIPGALRQTELALEKMNAPDRFEDLVVLCLQDYDRTLRPTGGSGDRQRDAVTGGLFLTEDMVLTISLQRAWPDKVRGDLVGLKDNPPAPRRVIAVSNRRTGARAREKLERAAQADFGLELRILDQRFLALRLLRTDLLPIREELLGLPLPAMPVALEAEAFSKHLSTTASHVDALYGRDADLGAMLESISRSGTTVLEGPGGVGKTRLALEVAKRLDARVLFLDDRAQLSQRELPVELAGADRLVLVVDNAHRRADLRELVGLLHQRSGPTTLVLVARPGFRGRLLDAVDGSALGPLGRGAILELGRLAPTAIGQIVRNAKPELVYSGAVDQVIEIADGNPLIALLAHGVAVEGGTLDQLGQDGVLTQHARSLITSLVEGVDDATEHDVSDLLAAISALTYIDLQETVAVELIGDLCGVSQVQIRRLLLDFADAGIVIQSGHRFAIAPDVLSGHILWSSFFAARPRAALPYERVWSSLAPTCVARLCDGLGGLPTQCVGPDQTLGRFIATQLLDRAKRGEQVLDLTRAVAPALPWLAAEIVDAALEHLPADPGSRARALTAAAEALARTPSFEEGWPRQLAVAAAAFANEGSESEQHRAARKRVTDDLTSVYSRVPFDMGPDEGSILAGVQHEMARASKVFWRRRRAEPGVPAAVAVAARQLLTVAFEKHQTTAEDEMRIQLQGFTLPATQFTREALFAGSQLFAETIALLSLKMQVEQAGALGNLAGAARGYCGPFGAQPARDTADLARETLSDLVARLSTLIDLPIVVRASLEEELGEIWSGDEQLSEFHDLFSGRRGHGGRDPWDEQAASRRVEEMARRVIEAEAGAAAVVGRWAAWLRQAQESGQRSPPTHIVGNALGVAASIDPVRIGSLIDDLMLDPGPLTGPLIGALVVVFQGAEATDARARRLVGSKHEEVRATTARAIGASSLPTRLDLLTQLVGDPSFQVRRGVQDALTYRGELTPTELDLALRACRPNDIEGVVHILWRVDQIEGRPEVVGPAEAAIIRDIVFNVAAADCLDGHDLQAIFKFTSELDPRLPIDFARARISHQLADEKRPLDLTTFMRRDSLPDEIRDPIQEAAIEDDLNWVLDQIEVSTPSNVAHGAMRKLLEWLDDGPVVTQRIRRWFDDPGLAYEAQLVLAHPLCPDRFRERARALLARGISAEVEDQIIRARHPRPWNIQTPPWRALRDEFAAWIEDDNDRVADLGRDGADHYQRLLDAEPSGRLAWRRSR